MGKMARPLLRIQGQADHRHNQLVRDPNKRSFRFAATRNENKCACAQLVWWWWGIFEAEVPPTPKRKSPRYQGGELQRLGPETRTQATCHARPICACLRLLLTRLAAWTAPPSARDLGWRPSRRLRAPRRSLFLCQREGCGRHNLPKPLAPPKSLVLRWLESPNAPLFHTPRDFYVRCK